MLRTLPSLSRSAAVLLLCFSASAAGAADATLQLDTGSGFVVQNSGATVERLRVDEATGNISRNGSLFLHTTGGVFVGPGAGSPTASGFNNTGMGEGALAHPTGGVRNTAFGVQALASNTGAHNSAFGERSMENNDTGANNTAIGMETLISNVGGDQNVAVGKAALFSNAFGGANVAVGYNALRNATAAGNIAVGNDAGINQTTGGNNIYIGHAGGAGEASQIRIGTSQADAYFAGIFGSVINGASALTVSVDSSGKLGTALSSLRFKRDVHDMAEASSSLMRLRPVSFRYREEYAVVGDESVQYGLIAEEVAEVAPELVAVGRDGEPLSVRYQLLAPMLLNELQKQQAVIEEQRREIQALEERLARIERSLAGAQQLAATR